MLYFKYNVCENDASNPFSSLSTAILATLDSQPVNTLVFDFRGNTGGVLFVIDPLLNGVYERIPSFLANPQFRVYEVIDKGTFSSGMDDAMQIKSAALAFGAAMPGANVSQLFTVIGEATGGEPNEFGEVVAFTLPGSGLIGQYSTKYEPAPAGIPNTPSFMPDVAISTRSTDYFARLRSGSWRDLWPEQWGSPASFWRGHYGECREFPDRSGSRPGRDCDRVREFFANAGRRICERHLRTTSECSHVLGNIRNSVVDLAGTGQNFRAGGRCRIRERTGDTIGRGARDLRDQ